MTSTNAPAGEPSSSIRSDCDSSDGVQHLRRVPWGAVTLFIVISFTLAWLVAIPLWSTGPDSVAFPLMLTLLASIMMFTPTVAMLVVVFLMRLPAKGMRLRFLGVWPLRPAKRVVWFTVAAVFAPLVVVVLSVAIAALCGWLTLDLVNFSGFAETLESSLPAGSVPLPPTAAIVVAQLIAIPFAAIINSVFAAGEELGWRGWLLPALRPLGKWPALVISGAIWGLWHAPLILLGYNFGLTDWRGVALMTAGCIAWGVLLGWSRLRSGSVWPAVVGHGALNASAGLFMIVAAAGVPVDAALVSPLGVAGWIAIAIAVLVLLATGQFGREAQLAPDRVPASS